MPDTCLTPEQQRIIDECRCLDKCVTNRLASIIKALENRCLAAEREADWSQSSTMGSRTLTVPMEIVK